MPFFLPLQWFINECVLLFPDVVSQPAYRQIALADNLSRKDLLISIIIGTSRHSRYGQGSGKGCNRLSILTKFYGKFCRNMLEHQPPTNIPIKRIFPPLLYKSRPFHPFSNASPWLQRFATQYLDGGAFPAPQKSWISSIISSSCYSSARLRLTGIRQQSGTGQILPDHQRDGLAQSVLFMNCRLTLAIHHG